MAGFRPSPAHHYQRPRRDPRWMPLFLNSHQLSPRSRIPIASKRLPERNAFICPPDLSGTGPASSVVCSPPQPASTIMRMRVKTRSPLHGVRQNHVTTTGWPSVGAGSSRKELLRRGSKVVSGVSGQSDLIPDSPNIFTRAGTTTRSAMIAEIIARAHKSPK